MVMKLSFLTISCGHYIRVLCTLKITYFCDKDRATDKVRKSVITH